jgi:uncharacterized protein (TIGR03435 family)
MASRKVVMKTQTAVYTPAVLVGAFILARLMAQAPPAGLRFEVASIKAGCGVVVLPTAQRISGSRLEIGSIAVKFLIAAAYHTDIQHVTAPAWTLQSCFAIQAIMPEGTTKAQLPEMMLHLLEERFHLTAKRSVSDQTAYALTVAKNGPKLKAPGEVDRSGCDTWIDDAQNSGAKMCTVVFQPDTDRTTVTIRTGTKWGPERTETSRRASETQFFSITMPQLADYLTGVLKSSPGLALGPYIPVLDRTGLEGKWRLTVERQFADAALSPPDGPVQRMPITTSLIADEVSAGLSKMGLNLEKTTAPIEMIVVDHLDQTPTEN